MCMITIKYHRSPSSVLRVLLYVVCIFWLLFPLMTLAKIDIIALLPNPSGDDTLGEYIELRNIGCAAIDLGWYHIVDASLKKYTFPASTLLPSHENLRLAYATTKIALNNSWIESVTLSDSWGILLDTYEYSGTQRDNVVIQITTTDDICITPSSWAGPNNSGSMSSGNTQIVDTGSAQVDMPGTGSTNTGNTSTGQTRDETWFLNTGSSLTGTEYTVRDIPPNTYSGTNTLTETGNLSAPIPNNIQFPDIVPTLQFPTNAIFSWSTFDCTGLMPCRINITLDPIFSGGILEKNFKCEFRIGTGSMVTCNPNTMYFSGSNAIQVHLTSNLDPSQSSSMTWEVLYRSIDIPIDARTGNLVDTGSSHTGWVVRSMVNTGSQALPHSHIPFPESTLTFQNYTNTSHSGDMIMCSTTPCRLNFTLDPIFTGSFLAREYQCEVRYGTGIFHTCNPPQLYLSGTWDIDITIIHVVSATSIQRSLQVVQSLPVSTVSWSPNSAVSADDTPPILILAYDGKLKSYHEMVGDTEMNCYSYTCAINLTAEKSYDVGWWEIRYLWYYGPNDIKTTKDPWERRYGSGNHEIWLRVIDRSGNVASVRYNIHVLGPRAVWEPTLTEKKISHKELSKNTNKWNILPKKKTKKKPKKMTFFDPPKIILQNSKFVEKNNRYLCLTKTKTCSLNLSLSPSQPGIIYTWIYDNGVPVTTKNPKSKILSPGMHTIEIIAGYSPDTPLWHSTISAEVVRIKKIKKPKVAKIVHRNWSVRKPKDTTPLIQSQAVTQNSDSIALYAIIALIGGMVLIWVLRRGMVIIARKI